MNHKEAYESVARGLYVTLADAVQHMQGLLDQKGVVFLEDDFFVPEYRAKLTLQASRGEVQCACSHGHLVLRVQRIIVEEPRQGLGTAVLTDLRTLAKNIMGRCLSVECANERLAPLLLKLGASQRHVDAEHIFCDQGRAAGSAAAELAGAQPEPEPDRFFNLEAIVAFAREHGQHHFGHLKNWSDKFWSQWLGEKRKIVQCPLVLTQQEAHTEMYDVEFEVPASLAHWEGQQFNLTDIEEETAYAHYSAIVSVMFFERVERVVAKRKTPGEQDEEGRKLKKRKALFVNCVDF
jgi:hypothetical protein